MKNTVKNIKRKNAGFTLLELVVVVAVMGLISTMALDVYSDHSNQKRFEATKERLAEIKFAIIGDPMMRVGSQAVLSGFYYDTGRLPKALSELIFQCRTSTDNIGVIAVDKDECVDAGNEWEDNWHGPYLNNIQSDNGSLVFRDAWGNTNTDDNYGWVFDYTALAGSLKIQSLGLNRVSGSTTGNPYENDYPVSNYYLVSETQTDQIDYLKQLQLTGYCVNTTTKVIDTSITDQLLCTQTWASLPTKAGYCIDKAAGTIDEAIISDATCIGTDIKWIDI